MKRKQGMKWLLLSILWIGLILLFSSQSGSESHGLSQKLAQTAGGIFFPDFGQWPAAQREEWLEGIDPLVRKIAHFLEYGCLGILMSLTVKDILLAVGKYSDKMKCGLIAFYPCMMIACADEILQISSGGRGASPADVILDCAGVVTGIIFCLSRVNADEGDAGRARFRARHRRR